MGWIQTFNSIVSYMFRFLPPLDVKKEVTILDFVLKQNNDCLDNGFVVVVACNAVVGMLTAKRLRENLKTLQTSIK